MDYRPTERRGSFVILTVTIILILIIVICGICVTFILEEETRKIVLFTLLALLLLIGMGAFLFFEYQRKEAIKKRDRTHELWLQQTLEEQRRTTRPTAPPMSSRTSWAFTTPWRQSRSTILPPYSPPHSEYSNNNSRAY